MIARTKDQDMGEVIRGPLMGFAIAVLLIAGGLAIGEQLFNPERDGVENEPPENPLFGSWLNDAIDELLFYLKWGSYLAVVGGSIMIGITLRLKETKPALIQRYHRRHPKQENSLVDSTQISKMQHDKGL